MEKTKVDLYYDEQEQRFNFVCFGQPILGNYIVARVGKEKAIVEHFHSFSDKDEFGDYVGYQLFYRGQKKKKRNFTGIIKCYDGFIVFEVTNHFKIKGKKNKHLFGNPYISFPCFEGEEWEKDLSMLTFKRQAPFNYPEQWRGEVTSSLRDGKHSPLVAINKSFSTVILSPLNHLLYGTVSINHRPKQVRCGIPRALKEIPSETTQKTLLVYGKGVNKTLMRWGRVLRKYYKVEGVPKDQDVSLKYLSYWTNAGSAYWYNSHKKSSYEETFVALKNHHNKQNIKFGSYQLDSWWYKRESDHYVAGIVEWEPKSIVKSKNFNSMLPFLQRFTSVNLFKEKRLSYVQKLLNTPIGCHYKQIARDSVYVKGNEEDYIIEKFAMPKNYDVARKLFESLFYHPKWRLAYIIHDWLQWMGDQHSAFNDIHIGPDYFKALDDVLVSIEAKDNQCDHLTLQLCMTQPHMTLNAVAMKSVTSIRSTCDSDSFFVEGTKRWRWHLYSSSFIQALGKYAFYDNRFSYKSHLHPLSAFSKFEMIWLGLSCGPIGIGDPIGKENVKLLKRIINHEGEIIKPDVPSMPLDQCYLYNPNDYKTDKGVTVYSHTTIPSMVKHGYPVIYALSFNAHPFGKRVKMVFNIRAMLSPVAKNYVVYNYFTKEMLVLKSDERQMLSIGRRHFYYQIIAPIIGGVAFLGDVTKHVACSQQLIKRIYFIKGALRIEGIYPENACSEWVIYSEKIPKNIRISHPDKENEQRDLLPTEGYSYRNRQIRIRSMGMYGVKYNLEIRWQFDEEN